jgi:hypothetical protein
MEVMLTIRPKPRHLRRDRADQVESSGQIGGDDGRPFDIAHFRKRPVARDPCIVDQERGQTWQRCDGRFDRRGIGDVDRRKAMREAGFGPAHVEHMNIGARRTQRVCNGTADPSLTAGDDGTMPGKPKHRPALATCLIRR